MLQEVEQEQSNIWEGYVDWKKRPAIKGHHGGMLAASFVLGKVDQSQDRNFSQ